MDRVTYLGAADPSYSLEIADPYGGDLDEFRRCYARIEDALAKTHSK
jgi:protein-tyrosine-phosphatase